MRLLLVEDEGELAALIAAALRQAGFAVDAFDTRADAAAALDGTRYDLVLLDIGLPDGSGLELLRDLRRRRDGAPVLILTARDGVQDRVAGLDAGADDYLVKPFHLDELQARVRALLRRPGGALGLVLRVGNLAFDTVARTVEVAGTPVPLTRRELALLEVLMRRAGAVIVREVLADALYGFGEPVGPNAVEVLVHRLRRKLNDAGAGPRIATLRGVGYLLSEAGE